MKSLLTVVLEPEALHEKLGTAAAFARARRAHLHVLVTSPDIPPIGFGDVGTSVAILQAELGRTSDQIDIMVAQANAALAAEAPGFDWSVEGALPQGQGLDRIVALRARVHDMMIVPLTAKRADSDAILLDAALIAARVPVLLVPVGMAAGAAAPRNAVIAWNDSSECAAAVRAALPLLGGAAVSVAIIDPAPHDQTVAEPGSGICLMLARHGLKAQVAVMARTLPRIGDTLTRHVTDQSADLLVMGAWGHSRLRESLFGGATREMIDLCPVPILMAH